MRKNIFASFKTKEDLIGVLDIGSDSVKFLIVKKEDKISLQSKEREAKIRILGSAIQDYKMFGVFESREFESDVIKEAIRGTLKEAQKEAGSKIRKVIVSPPPYIFRARVALEGLERKNPKKQINKTEKEEILNQILEKTKKAVARNFSEERGLLPQELCFSASRILGVKIDGYKVSDILGFGGGRVECRSLVTFLPRYYLGNIKRVIESIGLTILRLTHETEGLTTVSFGQRDILFLDIGSDFTQMFFIKGGVLEKILEFEGGVKDFTLALSQKLGMSYDYSKEFLQRYQRGLLEEETRERVREILWSRAVDWFSLLKDKLSGLPFFEEIVCLGGGAFFSETKELLTERLKVPVKDFEIKDFLVLEGKANKMNLQFAPSLLITHAI